MRWPYKVARPDGVDVSKAAVSTSSRPGATVAANHAWSTAGQRSRPCTHHSAFTCPQRITGAPVACCLASSTGISCFRSSLKLQIASSSPNPKCPVSSRTAGEGRGRPQPHRAAMTAMVHKPVAALLASRQQSSQIHHSARRLAPACRPLVARRRCCAPPVYTAAAGIEIEAAEAMTGMQGSLVHC